MGENFKPPSRFQNDTYSQIENLMSDCNQTVPNLIGKIREIRYTKQKLIVRKGYKTKDVVGRYTANTWKSQIHKNNNIIKVLDQNKLNEEVDDMLALKIHKD